MAVPGPTACSDGCSAWGGVLGPDPAGASLQLTSPHLPPAPLVPRRDRTTRHRHCLRSVTALLDTYRRGMSPLPGLTSHAHLRPQDSSTQRPYQSIHCWARPTSTTCRWPTAWCTATTPPGSGSWPQVTASTGRSDPRSNWSALRSAPPIPTSLWQRPGDGYSAAPTGAVTGSRSKGPTCWCWTGRVRKGCGGSAQTGRCGAAPTPPAAGKTGAAGWPAGGPAGPRPPAVCGGRRPGHLQLSRSRAELAASVSAEPANGIAAWSVG